jgi:hypothetical protein
MKKEDILKLFPSILEDELIKLPEEFVVCWYPSSGNHFDSALDWREQKTKLIPELFIYTDTSVYEIPSDAEVIFSKIFEGGEFRKKIVEEEEKKEEWKRSWEGTLLEGIEYINLNSQQESDSKYFKGIVQIIFLKLKDNWFFLVQVENEYLYLSFEEKGIKIDCLYVNRPCDSFLSDRGPGGPDPDQINLIDIERIGVDLLISGRNNGLRVPFSDDYLKISEFEINNEPFEGDIGFLYSRI